MIQGDTALVQFCVKIPRDIFLPFVRRLVYIAWESIQFHLIANILIKLLY